jgi:hypothetical protein
MRPFAQDRAILAQDSHPPVIWIDAVDDAVHMRVRLVNALTLSHITPAPMA